MIECYEKCLVKIKEKFWQQIFSYNKHNDIVILLI